MKKSYEQYGYEIPIEDFVKLLNLPVPQHGTDEELSYRVDQCGFRFRRVGDESVRVSNIATSVSITVRKDLD